MYSSKRNKTGATIKQEKCKSKNKSKYKMIKNNFIDKDDANILKTIPHTENSCSTVVDWDKDMHIKGLVKEEGLQ